MTNLFPSYLRFGFSVKFVEWLVYISRSLFNIAEPMEENADILIRMIYIELEVT